MLTSIVDRAAKLGFRFDVRSLRDFVLIDEKTGETHNFQSADALRDFLTLKEQQRREFVRP